MKIFRAYDKLRQEYIYPDTPGQQHYILTLKGEFYNLQNGSGGDEYIVEQWTGLKDKNGREIFEGDIFKYYGAVEWIPDILGWGFMHRFDEDDPERYNYISLHTVRDLNDDSFIVIGNINQNPELLKV